MWAAIGNALKNLAIKKAKKTAMSAAAGDESSQKKILIVVITAISVFLIIIVVVIAVIFGPIMIGKEYIEQMKNSTGVLFEKINNVLTLNGWCAESDGSCSKLAEQEYYEELNSVYQSYSNKSITIDEQLITGTIFYGYAREDIVYQEDEDGYNQGFIDKYCEANAIGWGESIGCPQYVKLNYTNIYDKYFAKYVSIRTNYDTLSKMHCSHDSLIEKLNSLNPGIKIIQSTTEEMCQYYLWNYADLHNVQTDSSYIIYKEGKDDIKKLAQAMVRGSRISLANYKQYLIDEYIPKNFESLIDESDREKSIERIADEIMMFASVKDDSGSSQLNASYGFCSYDIGGNSINTSDIEVVLLTCDGSQELERVDFETYISGVVYGEVGASWPAEVLKTQAVATRSYTLTRNQTLCPGRPNNCEYGYNPNTNEIRMRNCEADQVYCDYKQGCQRYNYNGFNSLVSGSNNPSLQTYKPALSQSEIESFESALAEVNGAVLVSEDNTIYPAAYINVDQNAWNAIYQADSSLDYNEILVKHYWNKTQTNLSVSSNCTNYGVTGEFSSWKQFDPRWGNVMIGPKTIQQVGCLVTSISIQFARSGTVNLPQFDPGIFANELTKRGTFPGTAAMQWAPLRQTLNELSNGKFEAVNLGIPLSGTKENKIKTLQQYINSGYLLVLGVKYEGHWVAVDRIENNEVYIFDPGSSYFSTISQGYEWGGVTTVQIYRVVP